MKRILPVLLTVAAILAIWAIWPAGPDGVPERASKPVQVEVRLAVQ